MDIHKIQVLSHSRAERWHNGDPTHWSPLEWAGAMAGETGEACNAAKKLKRVEDQIHHHDGRLFGQEKTLAEQRDEYRSQIAKEAADSILYGILLIDRVGMDAATVLKMVFNAKSEEYGFPERL